MENFLYKLGPFIYVSGLEMKECNKPVQLFSWYTVLYKIKDCTILGRAKNFSDRNSMQFTSATVNFLPLNEDHALSHFISFHPDQPHGLISMEIQNSRNWLHERMNTIDIIIALASIDQEASSTKACCAATADQTIWQSRLHRGGIKRWWKKTRLISDQ